MLEAVLMTVTDFNDACLRDEVDRSYKYPDSRYKNGVKIYVIPKKYASDYKLNSIMPDSEAKAIKQKTQDLYAKEQTSV